MERILNYIGSSHFADIVIWGLSAVLFVLIVALAKELFGGQSDDGTMPTLLPEAKDDS